MPVISAIQAPGRTDLAAGVVGGRPRAGRDREDGILNVVSDGEPGGVGQAPSRLGEPGQEAVGAVAGIRADQHPAPHVAGQLRQGQPGGLDVIGCGVRAAVPGAQHDSQRLTRAFRAVISENGQRVMAVGFLPRGHGLLLVRAGGHDCRVDVDRDQAAVRAGRGITGQFPGPRPGCGPRGADGLQCPGRISGQAGDQPGDHRIGGRRPEELWLRPEHRHICQAVPAQRHGHRQVGDDLSRAVHGPWLAPPFQCGVQAAVQATVEGAGGADPAPRRPENRPQFRVGPRRVGRSVITHRHRSSDVT